MPVLDLTQAIAEASSEPLAVELGGGRRCLVKAPSMLSAEALDKLQTLIVEWDEMTRRGAVEGDSRLLSLALRIPALVMDAESYDTWLQAAPPMTAFAALLEEINKFYASAGSLGEGRASDAS